MLEKVERQQPTLLAAEAAQQLYNYPHRSSSVLRNLHRQLNDHYQKMLITDKPRAVYLRERTIWVATIAPLLHRAELELMKAALPLMQQGESLCWNMPHGETAYDSAEAYTRVERQAFTPARRDFIYAAAAWTVGMGKRIGEDRATNSMWLAYASSHAVFCDQEQKRRRYQRPVDPSDHFVELLTDASDVPMELLDQFGKHYGQNLSPEACKQAFLSRVDEFAWAASARRRFFVDHIMNDWKNEGKCPYNRADDVAANGIWRVASLRGGPWRVPGFCPANIMLRPPTDDDMELINQLRALCGQEASSEGASAAWMHMVFGAHLAKETLWSDPEG